MFLEEPNARIHLAAAILVVILGFFVDLSGMEWVAIIACIAVVLISEAINSSIENLSDAITPDHNIHIKKAKDIGAAAVLLSAVMAAIIGGIIFIPKLSLIFQ
jgi:diacylglycerol kinase